MIQCERGHFFDENRYASCPYCSQYSNQPKSVTPPVVPANMQIPTPSCGKTVAIAGMEPESSVSKTVALDGFDTNPAPINKTVAIAEEPLDFPPVTPIAAEPQPAQVPLAAPVVPFSPAPAANQPVMPPVQAAPAVSPMPGPAVAVPVTPMAAPVPSVQAAPVAVPVSAPSFTPVTAPSVAPVEAASPAPEINIPVTGLGVTEHPTPIAMEEKFYESSPDRPYAVTGLGVKEHPTPIPNDVGATFPIPSEDNTASAPVGQAEASAFAAFGFPGGPIPGMMPGNPGAGVQIPSAAPAVEEPAVNEVSAPVSEPVSVPEVNADPIPEAAPAAEADTPSVPEQSPASFPSFTEPVVRDANATVSLTESDVDYLPRVHARAFLVCIDGPMTGASYVFQESRAVIGRQKNYEIALYRDVSVSRSQHAIINYYSDSFRYTVSLGDADKKVSVNGTFIDSETDLKLYDVIGIGQTRLLFIPVCSEKFAW
ncbi:MAG: hypothetical protein J6Y58_01825 [Clostridiales bacterium]|nr:hypothetical protein [Clostridiales bacterium]